MLFWKKKLTEIDEKSPMEESHGDENAREEKATRTENDIVNEVANANKQRHLSNNFAVPFILYSCFWDGYVQKDCGLNQNLLRMDVCDPNRRAHSSCQLERYYLYFNFTLDSVLVNRYTGVLHCVLFDS